MKSATFEETPKSANPASFALDIARLWMDMATAAPRALLATATGKPRVDGPTATLTKTGRAAMPRTSAATKSHSAQESETAGVDTAPRRSMSAPTPVPTLPTELPAGLSACASWYRRPAFAVPAPREPEATGSWYRTPEQRAARASVQSSPLDPFGLFAAFAPAQHLQPANFFSTGMFPMGAGTFEPAAWEAMLGGTALPADLTRFLWSMAPPTVERQLPLPLAFMLPPQPSPPAVTLPWLPPKPSVPTLGAAWQGPALAPVPQIAYRTASGHAIARVVAQSATTAASVLLAVAHVANQIGPFLPSEMLLPTLVS